MKEKISITLDSSILKEIDSLIDGIRIRNRSQAIEFLIKKSLSEKKTAVILSGGEENRLKVNGVYKPLLKYKSKTTIEHIIEWLRKFDFSDIYIVGRKNVLSEIFKVVGDGSEFGVSISYVEEKEEKMITKQDTAKTLKLLNGTINKPFLCIYCDVLCDFDLEDLWRFHIKSDNIATMVVKTSKEPRKWGNVEMVGNRITKFVEKPKKEENYLVYTGIFVANPEIFKQQGFSLEYEIFPRLAEKGMLGGYIVSGFCEHVDKF